MVKFKAIILLYSCVLLLAITASAQQISRVTRLASSLNTEAEETTPLFDGVTNRLYFSRVLHPENKGGKYSGSDIWYQQLSSGIIEKSAIDILNDKGNNFIIGINDSEDILYLNNSEDAEKGIYFSKKLSDDWLTPEPINIKGLPISGYRSAFVSSDYKVILFSMNKTEGYGKEDLYISFLEDDGEWSKPLNLGVTINTEGSEISPFLSPDKKTLYFSSNGHGGYGDMDIFKVERLYDSWTVWSKPENLGNRINSDKFDGYFSIYSDTLAYLSSNRDSKFADIYQVNYEKPLKRSAQSISYVPITSASSRESRKYLSSTEVKDDLGLFASPNIPLTSIENLENNDNLKTKLALIAFHLNANPQLAIAINIEPSSKLETSIVVNESSQLILVIYKELLALNVNKDQIKFDGISKKGEINFYGENLRYLVGLKFFE
jgi:hypothetical protein